MSIEGFGYKEQFVGTEDEITAFPFDFKIFQASHLRIYIQDHNGEIITDVTGDDAETVASVTFDAIEGGGTLNLAEFLPNAYVLSIFLANDFPDQPTEFANKSSFTMEAIEGALDFLAAWGQRLAFFAQRSIRLHDLDDVQLFDMRLPINLSDYPNALITINADGTGFAVDTSLAGLMTEINAGIAACLASEIAAANSASDASLRADDSDAAATAAEAALAATLAAIAGYPVVSSTIVHSGPFATISEGNNLDLPGETTDHTVFTMVECVARIQRGINSYARQEFTKFYRNGLWEIAIGPDLYNDNGADHGVTFTVDVATGQINAAVASDGSGDAIIDINKINWVA